MTSLCRLVISSFLNGLRGAQPANAQKINHVVPRGGEMGRGPAAPGGVVGGSQGSSPSGQQDNNQDKPVVSTTILVRQRQAEWQSQQANNNGRSAGGGGGGGGGDWYRRGIQISAAIGIAFNFMHHQLRVRAVSRQHRQQHQQSALPACLYVSGLGLQAQVEPSFGLGPSSQQALPSESTQPHRNSPPSLEDLERLDYDPLKLDAYLEEEIEVTADVEVTEEEECTHSSDEEESASFDWDQFCGKKAANTMAAVEAEIASLADTHQGLRLVVSGNVELGKDLLLRAAKAGNSEAMYNLGVIYEQEGKELHAMRFYQAASELDYAAAYFNLAVFHERGKAGLQPSSVAAIALYKKAARLGLPEAVAALRDASVTGVQQKEKKKTSEKKSNKKQVSADQLFQLARAYHYGLSGMPVDRHHAAHLYRLASEQGHKKSKRAYTELLQEFLKEAEEKEEDICSGKEIMISNSGF